MNTSIWSDFKRRWSSGDLVFRLLVINVVCFVVPFFVTGIARLTGFDVPYLSWVALSSDALTAATKPWTLLSYQFFHGNVLHLLFNSVMLFFTGQLFLTFFTQKQYLAVYLVGGIAAGLSFVGFYQLAGYTPNLLLGASASVMAVLGAVTAYQPHYALRLAIFGNVKLWHITLVLALLDVLQLGTGNFGGRLAHLVGLGFGWLYTVQLRNGVDLAGWMSSCIDWIGALFRPTEKQPFKSVHRNYKKANQANTTKTSRIVVKDKTQVQIDAILDKISSSGYDSLTEEEKTFLFNSGNKK